MTFDVTSYGYHWCDVDNKSTISCTLGAGRGIHATVE